MFLQSGALVFRLDFYMVAEQTLSSESKGESNANAGATPFYKPMRKKGFHRALKRGESWANTKKMWDDINESHNKLMNGLATELFKLESSFYNGDHFNKTVGETIAIRKPSRYEEK